MELLQTEIGKFYYNNVGKSIRDLNVVEILSIPYAKAERLEYPVLIDTKEKEKIVNKKESLCFPQRKYPKWLNLFMNHFMLRSEFQPVNDMQTEEAFVVNIWAEEDFENKKPVIVFIHGGGEGSGTVPLYKMENLATQGIVCVNITYRVGNFGYMPTFDGENTKGALAYLDQQIALEWIKENIVNFGGDNKNITLMGHCGGAIAALYHYLNPISNKLFHKLILCAGNLPIMQDLEQAKRQYNKILEKNKFNDSNDLKKLFVKKFMKIKNAQNDIIDGKFFKENPMNILERGEFPSMPVFIGTNKDEFSMIEYPLYYKAMGITKNEKKLDEVLRVKYGEVAEMLKTELKNEAKNAVDLQIQIMEILVFHSSAFYLMEKISEKSKVYGYRLNYAPYFCDGKPGSYHGAELIYIFNNIEKMNIDIREEDREAIKNVQKDFVEFIKTGTISDFQTYNQSRKIIEYDKEINEIDFPHKNLIEKILESGIADKVRKEYIENRR